MTTISALPTPIDLALYAGDDFRLDLAVADHYGQPVDLTEYTATAQVANGGRRCRTCRREANRLSMRRQRARRAEVTL